ncbi:MAG: hypothetical protein ABSA46_11900 [Thermodesulfovibrionales bacterium]|jgi:hypothetical protein
MKGRSQSVKGFLARRELLERIEEYSGRLTSDDIGGEKLRKQKSKKKKKCVGEIQKGGKP